jgi:hypothetical protein
VDFKSILARHGTMFLESQLFRRLKQEDFKASLGYTARPHLKRKIAFEVYNLLQVSPQYTERLKTSQGQGSNLF